MTCYFLGIFGTWLFKPCSTKSIAKCWGDLHKLQPNWLFCKTCAILGFLCGPKKRKAYVECIMPFRIMHLKSTWQCCIFGFFCLLKHGCLASIYSLHFCYAFLLCLFLLYTIEHLISVWFFLGSILWYSQSGNQPPDNLAKFAYKQDIMKVL